jgi:hypothetical protein
MHRPAGPYQAEETSTIAVAWADARITQAARPTAALQRLVSSVVSSGPARPATDLVRTRSSSRHRGDLRLPFSARAHSRPGSLAGTGTATVAG